MFVARVGAAPGGAAFWASGEDCTRFLMYI